MQIYYPNTPPVVACQNRLTHECADEINEMLAKYAPAYQVAIIATNLMLFWRGEEFQVIGYLDVLVCSPTRMIQIVTCEEFSNKYTDKPPIDITSLHWICKEYGVMKARGADGVTYTVSPEPPRNGNGFEYLITGEKWKPCTSMDEGRKLCQRHHDNHISKNYLTFYKPS